ncbi:hypothetical protein FIU86_08410 [Roseovarius sp. THAF9]|uniref:DUF2924 domain-containing protein n=1 Tax=Roseovarius sp. THAF9 TaxID=2587847 RepID=UPI001267EC12|nr:DUF2924 domain-containing protein [Roseovarius sp. THAF9]QFT92864.1 hypothetical protein FIU86_08410 [Roseovarius sp. THAF9]
MTLPNVDQIETMDRAALIAVWNTLFEEPVPKSLSQYFLRRILAFEIQARSYGGLPKGFLADLERCVAGRSTAAAPTLRPGGRLLREWNGVTHAVEVTESGYLWKATPYKSLSSVARAITGARWSGPRFFGLKGTH